MSDRIEFVRSTAAHIGLILAALAMVAGSWLVVHNADNWLETMSGWAGVVFFGTCLLAIVYSALLGGLAIVFDGAGIHDKRLGIGIIPWGDIEQCRVARVQNTAFLSLSLRYPEPYLSRLSPLKRIMSRSNQRLGFGHVSISFSGLKPGIDTAVDYIREHHGDLLSEG